MNRIGLAIVLATAFFPRIAAAASNKPSYYAHPAALDAHGVIAPWYKEPNGQCDLRVRIAAETLKRYPWTTTNDAVAAYPHYLFTSMWGISSNGVITPKNPGDWMNGDLGQRATSVLIGMTDYYRYSGDATAIAHLSYMADYLLDYCQTPAGHPWPRIFISVPVKGKAYGNCDPNGMIQLDIVGSTGLGLLRAYQVASNPRWLAAAKHWGDLLAQHCNGDPKAAPWPRYTNPENSKWKDNQQTGGVVMIVAFLDELIRLGYDGADNSIVKARRAGVLYLREQLLPAWTVDDTWGRYFWDWLNPTHTCSITADAASYIAGHPEDFPNWRNDARNVLGLFLNHSSADAVSGGDVYSGAWAFPESSCCCGRSLWYAPLMVGSVFAQYAVQTGDPWARELALRQMVLQTYDMHQTGVSEDNIDGGIIVNGSWLNIAHPWPLRWVLTAISWMPEELGASRENHIVRSSAVVKSVVYGAGRIEYTTFDAPAGSMDVLRLSFVPKNITADGHMLGRRGNVDGNGYTVKKLANGDSIVQIRHDGTTRLVVTGKDPQKVLDDARLAWKGQWCVQKDSDAYAGALHQSNARNAAVIATFEGNQVRLIGRMDPYGGRAAVYLDGVEELVLVDCWNPAPRHQQVLFYKNGLPAGRHTLKIVAGGTANPYAKDSFIYVDAVQFSKENASCNFPSGGGPRQAQRMVFGRTDRSDYRDQQGNNWRPGLEVVSRIGPRNDTVARCWWTDAAAEPILGTPDPELYRYGFHASDFWVNLTVAPGKYKALLKFAATRDLDTRTNSFDISINGREAARQVDVASRAGGPNKAFDLVFSDIAPVNGVIEIRFTGQTMTAGTNTLRRQAFVQAIELEPAADGKRTR